MKIKTLHALHACLPSLFGRRVSAVIIPGAYSSFQLFAAFRRWPGYEVDDLHGNGDYV